MFEVDKCLRYKLSICPDIKKDGIKYYNLNIKYDDIMQNFLGGGKIFKAQAILSFRELFDIIYVPLIKKSTNDPLYILTDIPVLRKRKKDQLIDVEWCHKDFPLFSALLYLFDKYFISEYRSPATMAFIRNNNQWEVERFVV